MEKFLEKAIIARNAEPETVAGNWISTAMMRIGVGRSISRVDAAVRGRKKFSRRELVLAKENMNSISWRSSKHKIPRVGRYSMSVEVSSLATVFECDDCDNRIRQIGGFLY